MHALTVPYPCEILRGHHAAVACARQTNLEASLLCCLKNNDDSDPLTLPLDSYCTILMQCDLSRFLEAGCF